MRIDSPKAALGLRVKELRAVTGITQEELADRAGVFRTYMSRIETGEANPTFTVLLALAEGLGCQIGNLFEPPSLRRAVRIRSTQLSSRGRTRK